jgi:hypothetical protein
VPSEEVELPEQTGQETGMKQVLSLALILASMLLASPSPAAPPERPALSLRVLHSPCSLSKVCQALSREFKTSVSPDPTLVDLRMVWAFGEEKPLETLLMVNPELAPAFEELLKAPRSTPAGQPVLLRLTYKVGPDPAAVPPINRVDLLVSLSWQPGDRKMPFSVVIPQLPSPFVPR